MATQNNVLFYVVDCTVLKSGVWNKEWDERWDRKDARDSLSNKRFFTNKKTKKLK
jgi:hypothetical protein